MFRWVLAIAAVVSACGRPAAPAAPTTPPAAGSGDATTSDPAGGVSACGQLQPLADCVDAAIAQLQREPTERRLAAFVAEARAAGVAQCEGVATTESWTRAQSSFDHFDDGSARVYIDYRFTHADCAPVALEVVLSMGESTP